MAIKVTGQNPPRTGELAGKRTRETDAHSTDKTGAAKSGTQAGRVAEQAPRTTQTTPTLTTAKLKEAIQNTPDVRTDRVAQVRQKLEQARYQVDPDKLATALLNESLRDDLEKP